MFAFTSPQYQALAETDVLLWKTSFALEGGG